VKYIIHTVEKKETLAGISKIYGVDKRGILADSFAAQSSINEVMKNDVREGMRLAVRRAKGTVYIAQPFDTLEKIAEKYGITAEELSRHNEGIVRIFLGQRVMVPLRET